MPYNNQAEIDVLNKAEHQLKDIVDTLTVLNNQVDKFCKITTAHRVLSETRELASRVLGSVEYLNYLMIQSDSTISFDRSKR